MPVTFHLDMDDSTFGVCRLQVDDKVCEIDFSDTTDAIGDLVRAAVQIAMGEGFGDVFFEREPGLWIWELFTSPLHFQASMLEVSVFDGENADASGRPTLIFRAECERDEFCLALLAEVDRLTGVLAPSAYEALFQQVVPRRAIEALRAALSTSNPDKTPPDLEGATIFVFAPDPDAEPFDQAAATERSRQWFRAQGRGIGLNRFLTY